MLGGLFEESRRDPADTQFDQISGREIVVSHILQFFYIFWCNTLDRHRCQFFWSQVLVSGLAHPADEIRCNTLDAHRNQLTWSQILEPDIIHLSNVSRIHT